MRFQIKELNIIISSVYFPLILKQIIILILNFIIVDDSGDKSKEPTKTVKGN